MRSVIQQQPSALGESENSCSGHKVDASQHQSGAKGGPGGLLEIYGSSVHTEKKLKKLCSDVSEGWNSTRHGTGAFTNLYQGQHRTMLLTPGKRTLLSSNSF